MKLSIVVFLLLFFCSASFSQPGPQRFKPVVSVGTRNTMSIFNSDKAMGKGIGGQFRVQFASHLNSEWYFDYITSKTKTTGRNDYHIGWSLLFYTRNNFEFTKLFQPYFIAGHCFDQEQVFELADKKNSASRLSMATQAGLGTHINITEKFDGSLSGQYMLHFGKEIETVFDDGKPVFTKASHTQPDGHLLFTLSFNYKLFQRKSN